ncbi:MAG: hypothetical protein JNK48_10010 [Bryobacterales bacterium]|nr:hypothetical protein [Bryobacterales bacterium]
MSEKVMIAIVMVALFTAVSYIVKNIVTAIQRSKRDRYMAEVSTKLVDKLGAAPDVMSFVDSEAYKTLLGEQTTGRGPFVSRVLNSLQTGLVLLFGGMGLFAASNFGGDPDFQVFTKTTGAIVMATGTGMALSAAWSYFLLKKWGFLNGNAK